MRQPHLAAVSPVMYHEQPTGQTLIDLGAAIGKSGVCDLDHEGLGELKEVHLERDTLAHGFSQIIGR